MHLAISTTETLTDLTTDLVVANNNNMSVVVICGNVCCAATVVKDSVILPWSVEVCCMFL